ncbi:HEAT repeat domain-containing protein [Maricaulis sp.]|uniref:HEAT repeat domain-containing protein n=1 Tax=Maricaulis sp. TaxID=1486257 RepID=UPI003A91BC85
MHSLEWIMTAAAIFCALGLGLVASAAIIVLFERWQAPVRASRDAYRTACLLDHVATGAPLPRVKSRRSARAWSRIARELAELLAGMEGDALRDLSDRFAALAPSRQRPLCLPTVRGDASLDLAIADLDRMATSSLAGERRKALRALVWRGHPDATKTFIRALRDNDAEARILALAGLADLRVTAASDRIAEMHNDPSWRVRETARRALRMINEPARQAEQSGVIQWI